MSRAPRATICRMTPLKKALVLTFVLSALRVPAAAAEGATISYEAGGEKVQAYLAKPAATGDRPGVVIVHHLWGLDAHTRSVADRLAELGYLAVAPDLYRGRLGADYGLAKEMMDRLDGARAVTLVNGAIGYLRSLEGGKTRRPIGLVGFGMGGRVALSAALQGADAQGLVIFYGHVETTKEAVMPLQMPVLGVFGTDDVVVTAKEAKQFEAALKAAGKQAAVVVYSGMAHAFFDDSRPDFDPALGGDAWTRTKDFLAAALAPASRPEAVPSGSATPAPPGP